MEKNKHGKYKCPCCGFYTYDKPTGNTFQVCPVCFWEDDQVQYNDIFYDGGANSISLKNARKNFKKFGAIQEIFKINVRKPTEEEI